LFSTNQKAKKAKSAAKKNSMTKNFNFFEKLDVGFL